MGKVVAIVFCIGFLFSCKKDKVFSCEGISMSGDRSVFVGKWRWYKTRVEQWFDVGPSIYSDYTPQNQGFEYFFTISEDGLYKGYKNNTLIHNVVLNNVDYETFTGGGVDGMRVNINCTSEQIELLRDTPSSITDSIDQNIYPLNFEDQDNQLRSKYNYFVRE
ncbi:MAG: hypothetical protein COA33_005710 [Fluviicola sp.]|nr:hypothetical protein [Fluviicola sp.]